MHQKDDLHDLIHALTQAEKRYFRVYAMKGAGDNKSTNYVRLFDAMAAMSQYDEEKLKKNFQGEPIEKNLPSEKNYLMRLILKSMRGFHAERSISNELHNLMMDLAFLKAKDLGSNYAKTLRKASSMAQKHEKFAIWLELLQEQRSIAGSVHFPKSKDFYLEEWRVVYQKYGRHSEYLQLFGQVLQRANVMEWDDAKSHLEAIEQITSNPLLHDLQQAQTFIAKVYFLMTKALAAHTVKQFKEANRIYREIIEHWEAHPEFIKEEPEGYVTSLSNYLNISYAAEVFDDFEQKLDKLRAFKTNSLRVDKKRFIALTSNAFRFHLYGLDLEKCREDAVELEAGLKAYGSYLSPVIMISFRFNLFVTYFLLEDRRKAMDLINLMILETDPTCRKDIQDASRLMLLLMYIDHGHFDILEYSARAVYRYFQKSGPLTPFAKVMVNFATKSAAQADLVGVQKATLEKLLKLKASGNDTLGLVLVVAWLKSKLNGVAVWDSYITIAKES